MLPYGYIRSPHHLFTADFIFIRNRLASHSSRSIKLVSTLELPKSKSKRNHYLPLCDLLNNCAATCQQSPGQRKGVYYDDLKFIVWDYEVKDGGAGAAALK